MRHFQDAFISYGRIDSRAFAKKLNDCLVEQGLDIWLDFDDIPLGVDYQNQINSGIESADNFLFIISPHSVNSPYCIKELDRALLRNKRIIPLMHVEQIDREPWQQRHPQGTQEDWGHYITRGLHSSFPGMHPVIARYGGHRDRVSDVSFSPDGKLLATASEDRTLLLWDLDFQGDLDKLLQHGCRWTQNYLHTKAAGSRWGDVQQFCDRKVERTVQSSFNSGVQNHG